MLGPDDADFRQAGRQLAEAAKRLNRPILPHLNHPNFGWGVTAEELAAEVPTARHTELLRSYRAVYGELLIVTGRARWASIS